MLIKVELDVDIPDDWIDLCTKNTDLFMQNYCGYWARGYQFDWGWLVYEIEDKSFDFEEEPGHKKALEYAQQYKTTPLFPLPAGWYYLDQLAAKKAYIEGVKRWGLDWYKNSDAEGYDVVVQMALLGEVRYG